MKFVLTTILSVYTLLIFAQPTEGAIDKVLKELNHIRSRGCKCGAEYMHPAPPLQWNETLYRVSKDYARYLHSHKLFSHVSHDGKTLGDRLDHIGYTWQRIGENLGRGYDDFYEVLRAWLESDSHCKMIMDPDVTDIGMSKHYDYWVQSFSKPMPDGSY